MSDATMRKLSELAEAMSTGVRKVSPMQVAAQLLEDALDRVGVEKEISDDREDLTSGTGKGGRADIVALLGRQLQEG